MKARECELLAECDAAQADQSLLRHAVRSPRVSEARAAGGLTAKKLQRRKDSRLADDQHDDPFQQVDLVGFHCSQQFRL